MKQEKSSCFNHPYFVLTLTLTRPYEANSFQGDIMATLSKELFGTDLQISYIFVGFSSREHNHYVRRSAQKSEWVNTSLSLLET